MRSSHPSGESENRDVPDTVPGTIIDQWIEAAAGVLSASGQTHFMHIDFARIAFRQDGVPNILSTQFSASPAGALRAENPHPIRRANHHPDTASRSPQDQTQTVITGRPDSRGGGRRGFISGPRLIQLVKRRNTLSPSWPMMKTGSSTRTRTPAREHFLSTRSLAAPTPRSRRTGLVTASAKNCFANSSEPPVFAAYPSQ
ncbi:hypothetical protein FB472_0027 [Rhodoglobus vestalii]|uniref:Uncharacterized protein n=1 Tax=Rhodoglobus vestalii TaxID=193384 RepID=A0A8H2K866_9MICO|nr:hypothetical protein FB472_0027 [Rhodoglobus vestalii]